MSGFTQMPKGIENHLKMYLEKSFQKKKKEKSYFSLPSLLLARWPFRPLAQLGLLAVSSRDGPRARAFFPFILLGRPEPARLSSRCRASFPPLSR
jgi:hypothetical protein